MKRKNEYEAPLAETIIMQFEQTVMTGSGNEEFTDNSIDDLKNYDWD